MLRFQTNRLWALILALILCAGGAAMLNSTPAAASGSPAVSDDPNNDGGGLPGNGYGDPDAPSGDSKRSVTRGGARMAGGGAAPAGDGADLQSAWMWRLRVVLQSLRGFWLHP
jgi:hypothetical protein